MFALSGCVIAGFRCPPPCGFSRHPLPSNKYTALAPNVNTNLGNLLVVPGFAGCGASRWGGEPFFVMLRTEECLLGLETNPFGPYPSTFPQARGLALDGQSTSLPPVAPRLPDALPDSPELPLRLLLTPRYGESNPLGNRTPTQSVLPAVLGACRGSRTHRRLAGTPYPVVRLGAANRSTYIIQYQRRMSTFWQKFLGNISDSPGGQAGRGCRRRLLVTNALVDDVDEPAVPCGVVVRERHRLAMAIGSPVVAAGAACDIAANHGAAFAVVVRDF